jgi:phosphotransferase system HPr (HPr) family protein
MYLEESSSASVVIKNRLGLHARAAAKLVRAASAYEADIRILRDGEAADARSVLSLISLGCARDSIVRLEAFGRDAAGAVRTLTDIIENRFGEE